MDAQAIQNIIFKDLTRDFVNNEGFFNKFITPDCYCGKVVCKKCHKKAEVYLGNLKYRKVKFNVENINCYCQFLSQALSKRFPDYEFFMRGAELLVIKPPETSNSMGDIDMVETLSESESETDLYPDVLGSFIAAYGLVFYSEDSHYNRRCAELFFSDFYRASDGRWYTGAPNVPSTIYPVILRNSAAKVLPNLAKFEEAFSYTPTTIAQELHMIYTYSINLSPSEIVAVMLESPSESPDWFSEKTQPSPYYHASAFQFKHLLKQLNLN